MTKEDFKPGYADVLLMIFVVLKLTNNIDWSWWWVLSPAWVILAIALIVAIVIGSKQ